MNVNTYNFVEKGCIFYHAIATSEEHAILLAKQEGFTEVEGLLTRIDASLYDTFNCEGYWMRHQS